MWETPLPKNCFVTKMFVSSRQMLKRLQARMAVAEAPAQTVQKV
jgi:hypothetical protein